MTERERRALRSRPEAEGASIVPTAVRKESGIDTHAAPGGSGVERNINRGMIGIRQNRALFERKIGVGVAQHQSWNASALQFLAQTAGQHQGHILFGKRAAERLAM